MDYANDFNAKMHVSLSVDMQIPHTWLEARCIPYASIVDDRNDFQL